LTFAGFSYLLELVLMRLWTLFIGLGSIITLCSVTVRQSIASCLLMSALLTAFIAHPRPTSIYVSATVFRCAFSYRLLS